MKWMRTLTLTAGLFFTFSGWAAAQHGVTVIDPVAASKSHYGPTGPYGQGASYGPYGPYTGAGSVPGGGYSPSSYGSGGFVPHADTPQPPGRPRPVLNNLGLCCNAHHTWFGCGNFHSEFIWAYGSCRTFYGETCVPKPDNQGSLLHPNGGGLFHRNGGGLFQRNGGGVFHRLLGRLGCSGCQQDDSAMPVDISQ